VTQLPGHWSVVWLQEGVPPEDWVLPVHRPDAEPLAVTTWRRELRPWGRAGFPLGAVAIGLRRRPTLDEIWTLWLWSVRERGERWDPGWERVGLSLAGAAGEGPASELRRGYEQLVDRHLLSSGVEHGRFLEEALELCAGTAGPLRGDDPIPPGEPRDPGRAGRTASLPLEASTGGLLRRAAGSGAGAVSQVPGVIECKGEFRRDASTWTEYRMLVSVRWGSSQESEEP